MHAGAGFSQAPWQGVVARSIWRQLARDTIKRADLTPDATPLYVWRIVRMKVFLFCGCDSAENERDVVFPAISIGTLIGWPYR